MIRSFGDRIFPVAYAGHASWQRPHSVHEKPSSTFLRRQVEDRRRAEAHLVVGHVEAQRLEPPGRGFVRANHTFTAAVAMCRCFEYGRYVRNPKMKERCAHTKTRSADPATRARTHSPE